MICERVNKSFEKTGSARLAFVRTVSLCLPLVFVFSLLLFSGFAFADRVCSTPGNDGARTSSGVINTYYPGTSSVSAGALSINSSNPPGLLPGAACVPKLFTSTKTVVDTSSGGTYAAGDVLQYTITLNETNGIAASGVSVTDAIDKGKKE